MLSKRISTLSSSSSPVSNGHRLRSISSQIREVNRVVNKLQRVARLPRRRISCQGRAKRLARQDFPERKFGPTPDTMPHVCRIRNGFYVDIGASSG
jgi:hypothetical protein